MLKNVFVAILGASLICFLPGVASAHVIGGQEHHHCHAHYHHGGRHN